MAEDPQLGTGSYDPEIYWNARAKRAEGRVLDAVCVFGASDTENLCADRVQRHLMRAALKRIDPRGKKVLEYGCGAGRWATFFQDRGGEWSGVDISEEMLELGRSQLRDVRLRKLEGGRIPHPDATFDLVYSVTVIHHNPHERQERIVSEMARVLRADGYLLLYEDLGSEASFNMFPRTLDGWLELAERQGFTRVWTRGARYWLLRGAAGALKRLLCSPAPRGASRRSGAGQARGPSPSLGRRILERLDLLVDPLLLPFVPSRYHKAAAMVFRKKGERAL